jgi:hypothetical protein
MQPVPGRVCDLGRIEVPGAGIHWTKHRHEAGGQDREEDHIVVHGRHQQTIPWLEPLSEGEVESHAARREKQSVPLVTTVEELLDFASLGARIHTPPTTFLIL